MYHVIIVDDETIVRTSLATIIDWEAEGFLLIGDAVNGKAALKLIQENRVDVVLTDIKMPVMDGLELIQELNQEGTPPVVIVLSAYSDFSVVRQAFKFGAVDYILKSDISAQVVHECIGHIKEQLTERQGEITPMVEKPKKSLQLQFKEALLGQQLFDHHFFENHYAVACFEVEQFLEVVSRFGEDLQHSLIQPMLNFTEQIPRVANRGLLTALTPSRYMLLYRESVGSDEMQFVCTQIQHIWKNYMNITTTCGISRETTLSSEFELMVEEAAENVTVKYICGVSGVFDYNVKLLFDVKRAITNGVKYDELTECMKRGNSELLPVKCQQILGFWKKLPIKEAKQECLSLVYQIAIIFVECNDNYWESNYADTNFCQKIARLESSRDLEIWSTNFIRYIGDYFEKRFNEKPADIMEKVKQFITYHYSDQALTQRSVAEYIGFNEKYFSTRFNREIGMTFSQYLTAIRVQMAKQMLETTTLKIYEVSEAVGYSNAEHFTRVFKKVTGMSPGAYRKD